MLCNVFKRNLFQIHIIICLYDFDLNITKNWDPVVFSMEVTKKKENYIIKSNFSICFLGLGVRHE